MQEKTQSVKAAEAVKQIWRLQGRKIIPKHMLEPKSTGYIQALEIPVFRVCVSHTELDWHWNSRHSKSQQSFGHIHNCTVCKWHALFCLEIERFKLFLWILKSKYMQHFIALNTRGFLAEFTPKLLLYRRWNINASRLMLGDSTGYRAISLSLKKYQGTRMLFLPFK